MYKTERRIDLNKHKAIIKAASKLFLKHGFSKATMDDIANEAGVTKQTVYSHFKSKDNLFGEMIKQQCEKHSPSEVKMKDETIPVENMLYEVGLGFLNMITSREGLATHRLVVAEAERRPKVAQLFFETGPQMMSDLLCDYIERQNQNGRLKIKSPDSAASYFFAMLKGRYHLRMALKIKPIPTKEEIENHVRETVDIFMALYSGKSPLMENKNAV